jgi:hypothetical protein
MGAMIVPGPRQFTKVTRKTVTFDGTAGLGEAGTAVPVATVTGEVVIDEIHAYCTTNLTEATPTATISLGVVGSVALFIAATNSVELDANEFWVDTAPDANGVAIPAALKGIVVTDNVIVTPATQDTDAGVIEFTIYWHAISVDGNVS